jgi:hypothetical protein
VALRDHGAFDPFGWSVACAGRKPPQVREEVRRVVEWAAQTWAMYFPAERGYVVSVESPAGPSHGVQLTVRRGDFRAQVAVENILDPGRRAGGALAVRMFGRAVSDALAEADRVGALAVQRGRVFGVGTGLGIFVALCWFCIGVHNPAYFLGGLLLVVAGLMCTMAFGTIGAWFGERVAERGNTRARAEIGGDAGLQDDLRRWRALVRQLAAQRAAIAGQLSASTPFRALPAARADTQAASRGRAEFSLRRPASA